MRKIGVVTSARSDYGIYLPLLRCIIADPTLQLQLYVTGSHLSPAQGLTVRQIEADGIPIQNKLFTLLSSDAPEAISTSIGLGVTAFAQIFGQSRPDILVVLGDRFDMYSAALAALPFKIPLLHLHGGEVTEGAIDEALRHSLTKLSHVHCVASNEYGRRIQQLGEEAWRVHTVGAMSLDNLTSVRLLTAGEVERQWMKKVPASFLLVTFHPETLEFESTASHCHELLSALASVKMPVIATLPNSDTSGQIIIECMREYARNNNEFQLVDNLGTQGYFSLMALATAMVGNSSSGIIEAPSFKLPVVNIGNRQKGRTRAANIIDVPHGGEEILEGIRMAISPEFKRSLDSLQNPFDHGCASHRVLDILKSVTIDSALTSKKFVDHPIQVAELT